MPPAIRANPTTEPGRADRLAHVRDLIEEHRHPERRVGIFSATNLTRLVLRFGGMALAAGLVHALLGGTVLELPVTAVAVGAVDLAIGQLWRRIRESVRRGWNTIGLVLALVLMAAFALGQVAPDSGLVKALGGWGGGLLERQQAKLDARSRAERTPVDAAAATDPSWQLLTDSGFVRRGTLAEAREWCATLGPEWQLPAGLGALPALTRWPDLGTVMYVWTAGGTGLQVGDGRKPAVGVSGSPRASEERAVLCHRRVP